MEYWQLNWQFGSLEVQSLGAMLAPVRFYAAGEAGGQIIEPLAVAPWSGAPGTAELPGILRQLRGEWPCVPFGITEPLSRFPARWQPDDASVDNHGDTDPHGYAANHHWYLVEKAPERLHLAIDYPAESSIARLDRIIEPDAEAAAVDIQLRVQVRRDCRQPIGLHPVLRLPRQPGAATLVPAAWQFGRTYPMQFEPVSRLQPDQQFDRLSRVPAATAQSLDLSRLPLPFDTEEIVQLCGIEGGFELINNEEGYVVGLQWDPRHFPSCLLWISNRGRPDFPWNGRHLGLGVEPVCSVFDLNRSVAANDNNPIARQGVPTVMQFRESENWETRYRLYSRNFL